MLNSGFPALGPHGSKTAGGFYACAAAGAKDCLVFPGRLCDNVPMADLLGMDPGRIERLRSPERLTYLDPDRVWNVATPVESGIIVDVGTGVGFLALPFARRLPYTMVYGCDILDGMLGLLAEEAAREGLTNLRTLAMEPAAIPLPDAGADLVIMAQVHHELDDARALLAECRRLLIPGGTLAIIDWKDEDNDICPPGGRRVPTRVIAGQMRDAGLSNVESHDVYRFHSFLTARME